MTEYEAYILKQAVHWSEKELIEAEQMAKAELKLAGVEMNDEHRKFIESYRKEYQKSLEVDYGK